MDPESPVDRKQTKSTLLGIIGHLLNNNWIVPNMVRQKQI